MPQSKRKLELICEMFRDLAAPGAPWLPIAELATEADRRQLNLSHALIGDYVRRYCINDPSNQAASPKHYLDTPRFVTSEPHNKRGRKYRLLAEVERRAFLRDPSEDLHAQPYAEVETRYGFHPAKPIAKPTARKPEARAHREARETKTTPTRDARIKVHELARELRIDHQKVIAAAQRLGADASLPKSRLDDAVATHVRTEFARKKESVLQAEPQQTALTRTTPQVLPATSRRTRTAAAPAKIVEPVAAVKATEPATQRRRRKSSTMAHKAASPDGAHPRKLPQTLVVVDVSNVAREECDEKGRAKLGSFLHLLAQLERSNLKIVAIADANLWGQIDREEEFKDHCRRGIIKQAPSRTEADAWILQKASEAEGYIISRDTFRERVARYPGIRDRVVSFMVFDGEVMLDPEHPFTAMIHRHHRRKK